MVPMEEPRTQFSLESPGGLVKVSATCAQGRVSDVVLESMPSFVLFSNKEVNTRRPI